MTAKTSLAPWVGSAGVAIPASANEPDSIVPYAAGLKVADKQRVLQALQSGLFDMGAEFVWRRAMTRLRNTVAGLGMQFIGEMLNRVDIDASSTADSVLTDYDTIRLAEALGVINATGSLKLRHALELIAHYAGEAAEDDLSVTDAVSIIRSCVQFALGEENMQVAVDFTRFRERLLSETIDKDDPQADQLAVQPPFFVSTALRVLLAAVKSEHGARLQHVLANISTLLPLVWPRIPESDRWSIGETYAGAVADGNEVVVAELKRALLNVAGFDYVPENLRSATYRRAAQAVITAHFSFDNFAGEVGPTKHLASLGSAIPRPALPECIRALLLVYLGNRYGHSFAAANIAAPELVRIPHAFWQYYFQDVLSADAEVLQTLEEAKPAGRLVQLLPLTKLPMDRKYPPVVEKLLAAASRGDSIGIQNLATRLLGQFKPT